MQKWLEISLQKYVLPISFQYLISLSNLPKKRLSLSIGQHTSARAAAKIGLAVYLAVIKL
jgi:hypothetical protein